MKYPKHSFFILFYFCITLAILLPVASGCTDESEEAMETGSPTSNMPVPLIVRSTVKNFTNENHLSGQDAASSGQPATRVPIEDGNVTKFSEGDAAGIFAVRNIGTSTGVIVDNINNTKLLYGTSSEGSTWTPEAAVTLYYYEDVTYVAYYPYKENITIDPTKSVNEITASFATKTELQPATDQSTGELYTASDLMTASGQATDSSDPTKKTLSLAFTHSYSLLVLKANVAKAKYKAPDGSFKYHPKVTALNADATATDVLIMGVKAYKIANGVFRALIKPAPGDYISGSYTTNKMLIKYNEALAGLAGLAAGQLFECEANVPIPGTTGATERALQVGDFYFADGTIWPGGIDTAEADPPKTFKDSPIGVVFMVGALHDGDRPSGGLYFGDPLISAYECKHGLVVSKNGIPTSQKWSENSGSVAYWLQDNPYLDLSSNILVDTGTLQGYTNTKVLEYYADNSSSGSQLHIISNIRQFRQYTPAPANSSGWYVPSCGEMSLIVCGKGKDTGTAGLTLLNAQLGKVYSGLKLNQYPFWTSSEYSGTQVIVVNTDTGAIQIELKTNPKSMRPILAF